jgi:hypothetical protein
MAAVTVSLRVHMAHLQRTDYSPLYIGRAGTTISDVDSCASAETGITAFKPLALGGFHRIAGTFG